MTGPEQAATPESVSPQLKFTVTLELFQPFALGEGEATATMVGGVLSRFTVTLVVAELPEVSVAVPEIIWPAAWVLTTTGEGHVWIGKLPAVQVNVTVTFELFHPAALGDGDKVAAIAGGALLAGKTSTTLRL